jgi:hypothetical protein
MCLIYPGILPLVLIVRLITKKYFTERDIAFLNPIKWCTFLIIDSHNGLAFPVKGSNESVQDDDIIQRIEMKYTDLDSSITNFCK